MALDFMHLCTYVITWLTSSRMIFIQLFIRCIQSESDDNKIHLLSFGVILFVLFF